MSNVGMKTGQRRHTPEKSKARKKMSKAEMQLAIIKKKECDAKALTIVEQLLEPVVNAQWFLANLRYINKSHLEDVIEERAIVKLCGYVLCNNPLTVVITQQYHISVKKNKVYDVSKRKNFCSSRCYGASSYLLEQMLTSPLWLRDKEEIPAFQLLPSAHEFKHSTPGEEVVINPNNFDLNVAQDVRSRTESRSEGCSAGLESASTDSPLNKQSEKVDATNDNHINNCSSEYVKNILNTSDDTNDRLNHIILECTEVTQVKCTESPYRKPVPQSQNCIEQEFTVLSHTVSAAPTIDTAGKETNTKKEDRPTVNEVENTETDKSSKCEEKDYTETFSNVSNTTNCENVSGTALTDELIKAEDTIQNKDRLDIREDFEVSLKTSEIKEHGKVSTPVDIPQHKPDKKKDEKKKRDKHKVDNSKKTSKSSSETSIYTLAMRVEKSVKEWITEHTLCLLLGEADEKQKLIEDITKHDKYLHICKRLNKLQIEDEREGRAESTTKDTLKPMPRFVDLEDEGKKMEIKVRAFYGERMEIGPITECDTAKKKEQPDPIFPLVDAYAPKALRRRIFLDKLNRTLPDLLRALAGNSPPHITAQYMYSSERSSAIKTLATTFALSATNIVFKTAEWTLVGLIIMKLLSIMDPALKALLMRKQASMYISMILMSYKLDSNYLDRLVAELTNNSDVLDIHNS